MTCLPSSQPLLRKKQEYLDFQDIQGLAKFDWKIGEISLLSGLYTRIDQVFIIWALICLGIFSTAQFFPISWYTQAIFWSILTLVGSIATVVLAWFWVSVEKLRWLVYAWVLLMLLGVAVTDMGIFLGWGQVLMYLCPLWLGLSAVGYLCTAVGLRSRAFSLMTVIHVGGIFLIPWCGAWQFLSTGALMGISLLILAELQWDMRPLVDYGILTPEQKLFNQQQSQLRRLN